MKTHPTPRMPSLNAFIVALSPKDPAAITAFSDLVAYVLSELPRLSAAGVAGYLQLADRLPDPRPDQPAGQVITGVVGVLAMPYGTPEALVAACEPLAAYINQTWPGLFFVPAPTGAAGPEDHASWWSWFKLHYDTSPAGGHTILGSWLLDGKALTNDRNATAKAVRRFIGGEGKGALLNFVGGKGVMEAKPRGGGTAVLPAWRKAYLHPSECFQTPLLPDSVFRVR